MAARQTAARRKPRRHGIPVMEGARSRRHQMVPIWKLRLAALSQIVRAGRPPPAPRSFLQFAGFPRSGHSLIGSLVDAHPGALVSHELDTMGLVENGLSRAEILALVRRNSARFMENGRYWNGFAYVVPDAAHGRAAAPRVVGDKKGDWAVRRSAATPDLLDRLHARMAMPCKWILVVRNPFDNIATMSMRRGGAYDRLRIGAASGADFAARLEAEKGASVPDRADDAMIEDYVALCEGTERLRARVAGQDWLELQYEAFTDAPEAGLTRLLEFLALDADPGFVAGAASIVRPASGRSRDAVVWSAEQIARVRDAVARFDFLARARAGEPEAVRARAGEPEAARAGDGEPA